MSRAHWFMGKTSHTHTGWLSQASQVSVSERAAKHMNGLPKASQYDIG